jgi:hypothetical protein
MMTSGSKTYHKVTTSLTAEQHEWIRRVAAQAQLEGVSITSADVIRLALTRLKAQLPEGDLRAELVAHVLKEVEHYPGRANRGLPRSPLAPAHQAASASRTSPNAGSTSRSQSAR